MNSTLQVRIDKVTKDKAKKVFKEMGIDTSSGVKMFLSHVISTGSMSFIPVTKNGFTRAQEKEMIAETKEALKNSRRFHSAQEAHAHILKSK